MKRLIVSVVALALMATGAAFAQSGSNSGAAAGSNAGRQWRIEIGTGLQPLHMGFIGVSPSAELERELVRKGQFFRENDGFYPSVILTGSCELSPRWELALTASMSWGYLQLCQYDTFGIDPEGQPRYDLRSFSKLGYRNVSPVPAFTVQGRYFWSKPAAVRVYSAFGLGITPGTSFIPTPSLTLIGLRAGGRRLYGFVEATVGPFATFVDGGIGLRI